MGKFKSFLKTAFDKQIDGTGLAIFRIAYSTVLLCEIAQMFYFRHLIFDKIPYVEVAEIEFGIPIGIWFISVLFIFLGLFTRISTIINYLMSLILIGSIGSYEYHVFYAYMGVNFIMMFMPVSQCLSIDRLLIKLKYTKANSEYIPSSNVSQLHYFYLAFLGVGIVYFDSIFLKTAEYSWYSGLGVWMPSSFPMMAQMNLTPLLNLKPVMLFLGYLTLVFEAVFIFIFFRKKFRLPVFIIGVGLHIGILITFPIPWFALTVVSIYLLFIPVSWWKKLKIKLKPTLKFYYAESDLVSLKSKIFFEHFDVFNKIEFIPLSSSQDGTSDLMTVENTCGQKYTGTDAFTQACRRIPFLFPLYLLGVVPGVKSLYNNLLGKLKIAARDHQNSILNVTAEQHSVNGSFRFFYYFLLLVIITQCLIVYRSSIIEKVRVATGIHQYDKPLIGAISPIQKTTKTLWGITSHSVFLDKLHYNGYNHIIAVTYLDKNENEKWLPIIDKNGQPSYYNYGTNWRKVSFSTNSRIINQEQLAKGIRDFTAFWAHQNNINLNDATFLIKVKKIDAPNGWEKDFLNRQIAKPWYDGGNVYWKDQTFHSEIKDIESI